MDPLPDLKICSRDSGYNNFSRIRLLRHRAGAVHGADACRPARDNTARLLPTGNTTSTTSCTPSYLGPVILAQKDRPVRVLFKNLLPTGAGGNLFIPVDTTYMGAGPNDPQNRATLHLHGGATPWISDGTPHQWTTPEGETPMNGREHSTCSRHVLLGRQYRSLLHRDSHDATASLLAIQARCLWARRPRRQLAT